MLRRAEGRLFLLALAVMAVNGVVLHTVKRGHDQRIMALGGVFAAERHRLVERIMLLLSEQLRSHASDYSWWDDMVHQVESPSKAWMDENLSQSLKTFGTSGWWLYRRDGSLVAAAQRSGDAVVPSTDRLPADAVRAMVARHDVSRFYWRTSGGLIECCAGGITTTADSERRLPAKGLLVIGRYVDAHYLSDLAAYCNGTAALADYHGEADRGLTVGSGRIDVTQVLDDWAGRPIATLTVSSTAKVIEQFKASRRAELWTLVGAGLAMLLLLVVGLQQWVRRPLVAISRSLAHDDAQPLERLKHDPTEFGELAALVRRHFDQRDRLRQEIGQRTAAEAKLQEALLAAQAAAQAKGAFLANMSHEIRTPMNGVLGMTALLLQTDLSGEQLDYARTIHASAEALLTVLNDVLDFSKIEAGKLRIEQVPFDLRQAVSEVADLLAVKADQQGIDLVVRYAPDLQPGVVGDPGRVRQVLLNLLGNAIKFTREGHVLVSVSRELGTSGPDQRLRIEVQDTGIGIAEDRMEAIFTEFEQADNTTTRIHGGTGLGLAICRRLAELMGGMVSGISRVGDGSTFWMSLPLPETELADEPPPPQVDLHGVRALVVDDNEVNRFVLCEQLARWGVERVACEDAHAALAALHSAQAAGRPFAVALLDHMMPGMDGEQLARAIRADASLAHLKLVMLTSYGRREDAAHFLALGFSAYLTKPVRTGQLQAALAEALARPVTVAVTDGPTAAAAVAEPRPPRRVLVAEDNAVNQKVIVRMLERLSCEVTVVADGAAAVEAAIGADWDLVLMDCHMPVLDGYDATRAIREHEAGGERHLAIVAMTANALAGDREACLAAGMDDYLAKPVRPAEVSAAIERWAVTNVAPPS